MTNFEILIILLWILPHWDIFFVLEVYLECSKIQNKQETSFINFYSMISTRYFNYVGYICYVEECKFSTSTHENDRIM